MCSSYFACIHYLRNTFVGGRGLYILKISGKIWRDLFLLRDYPKSLLDKNGWNSLVSSNLLWHRNSFACQSHNSQSTQKGSLILKAHTSLSPLLVCGLLSLSKRKIATEIMIASLNAPDCFLSSSSQQHDRQFPSENHIQIFTSCACGDLESSSWQSKGRKRSRGESFNTKKQRIQKDTRLFSTSFCNTSISRQETHQVDNEDFTRDTPDSMTCELTSNDRFRSESIPRGLSPPSLASIPEELFPMEMPSSFYSTAEEPALCEEMEDCLSLLRVVSFYEMGSMYSDEL